MWKISNQRRFTLFLVIVMNLWFSVLMAASDSKKPLWVKAQGRLDIQGTLLVKTLKQRKPGKQSVLEGIVEKEVTERGAYVLAGIEIIPQAQTKYTYINGEHASKTAVKKNVRIKAIGSFVKNKFYAEQIRIFQYSLDDDVEVEGPITLVENLKDGRKLYRVGSVLMFLNRLPSGPANKLQGLSKYANISGKFQVVDNSRSTDIPEEEITSGTKRYAKLQTTLKTTFSDKIMGYSRVEFFWRDRNQTGLTSGTARDGFDFRVRDLYLALNDLAGLRGLQLTVGRQRFRDVRTWLMDSRLDGLQLGYARPGLRLAFAATRKIGARLTHREQPHYIGSAYFGFSRSFKATFYAIKEVDERAGRDDPLWLAVQMRGKVGRFLEWWAQGARYSSQDGTISRRGYGTDAGLTLRPFSKRTGPFLTYHFAYGSADDAQTADVKEAFRQPRLQLNYYKAGYQKRLFYYGSLLTPELSNLKFQALGLGYVFSRKISLQGIWRFYSQIQASKKIRSNSLGFNPEGLDTDLGQDAEVVLHLFPLKPLEFSFSAEWFFPGAAFAAQSTTLFKLRGEVVFYF